MEVKALSVSPEIIKRCKDGDREAFNTLIGAYQTRVINIAFGIMGSKEDALDAAQETFVKIFKGINAFGGKSSLDTWIYRVTVNTCMDLLRKRSRTVQTQSLDAQPDGDSIEQEIPDTAPTPEQNSERLERTRVLRAAIAELSPEYREVITLFDIEGFSYDEIGKILSLPLGTVKSRLARARKALKKVLSENMELFI